MLVIFLSFPLIMLTIKLFLSGLIDKLFLIYIIILLISLIIFIYLHLFKINKLKLLFF